MRRWEEEGRRQIELPSQIVENADRDCHVIGDKAAVDPQGTELKGKAPAIVVPATPQDFSRISL
jgi:hypothetical protein